MGERMLRTSKEIAKEIHIWAGRRDPVPENRRVWSDPRHKQPGFRRADGTVPGTGAGAWPHPATVLGRAPCGAAGTAGTAPEAGRYGWNGPGEGAAAAGEGTATVGRDTGDGTALLGPGTRADGGTGGRVGAGTGEVVLRLPAL